MKIRNTGMDALILMVGFGLGFAIGINDEDKIVTKVQTHLCQDIGWKSASCAYIKSERLKTVQLGDKTE